MSERTGQVVASYLDFATTNGTTGTLKFTVGIGERGVPLSPDTLVLPASVDRAAGHAGARGHARARPGLERRQRAAGHTAARA